MAPARDKVKNIKNVKYYGCVLLVIVALLVHNKKLETKIIDLINKIVAKCLTSSHWHY